MEVPRTKICLQTTLSFVIFFLFVVNVASLKKDTRRLLNDNIYEKPTFSLNVKGFATADPKDPEIIEVGKFAITEHNNKVLATQEGLRRNPAEPCISCSDLHGWEFVDVYMARKLNMDIHNKKYALIIAANDGPIGDFVEAMVYVTDNKSRLVAFIEPKDEALIAKNRLFFKSLYT